MALEMKTDSKWWYARFYVDGKAKLFNLEIPIRGQRPASLKTGPFDSVFLESRGRAMQEHDRRKSEILQPKRPEEYVQRLHELRTGHRIDSIALANLADEWAALPRKRKVTKSYSDTGRAQIKRFMDFVMSEAPKVKTMADVTPEIAQAFMRFEEKSKLSSRTYNGVLGLMKSAFEHLARKANLLHNPFEGIPTKEMETIHRQPFNEAELASLLHAADNDPFLRPIIMTGVCTAMRLGDCCCLRWDAVDLDQGFVSVKTSKTGATTDIPMFPLLRTLLEVTPKTKSLYVFPAQAIMYQTNRSGISYRLRHLFEDAGFYDVEKGRGGGDPMAKPVALPAAAPRGAALEKALKQLQSAPESANGAEKRGRVVEALTTFAGGKNVTETALQLGVAKSTVSNYLSEAEKLTGLTLRGQRGRQKSGAEHLGNVHAGRSTGRKRATIRDFHSFRVTWITLALTAGVPLELVQRVTGHKTTDVVLKHYFRPGREDFRRTLEGAMPQLFQASGQKSLPSPSADGQELESGVVRDVQVAYQTPAKPAAMIRAAIDALEKQTGRNWKAQRDEALQSLRGAAAWVEGRIVHDEPAEFTRG